MFTSNSFGKNCAAMPENSSPGRCNTTNRFPVGITSVGDENQHIRIQLAVHKYNNSSSCSPNNRRSLISPIKHSFFKNPRKSKNFEGDADLASKAEKKCENRYEGVGNFPTVHLRKRAVLYRPIKKFNEVKVPYPELPVNRYIKNPFFIFFFFCYQNLF